MYRCALPEGPVRSASRGSPAAKSIRLALRTSSIVATRSASFVRWVLRCFGRRRLSSEPRLSAISLMPVMMRFQVPSRAQSLNHKQIPQSPFESVRALRSPLHTPPVRYFCHCRTHQLCCKFASMHVELALSSYLHWRYPACQGRCTCPNGDLSKRALILGAPFFW